MPLDIKALQRERSLVPEEVTKLADVVEKAGADDTPYPVNTNEGSTTIIGDPNKTKRKPQLYLVKIVVDKDTSKFTKAELEGIAVEFEETELEYHLILEIPVAKISIDMRETISYAMTIIVQMLFEEVKDDDGSISYQYINNRAKRSARILALIQDKDLSTAVKTAAITFLDLPEGLQQMTTSQAVVIVTDFLNQNPDLVNEIAENLA